MAAKTVETETWSATHYKKVLTFAKWFSPKATAIAPVVANP